VHRIRREDVRYGPDRLWDLSSRTEAYATGSYSSRGFFGFYVRIWQPRGSAVREGDDVMAAAG
jgi:hypothetical protein